MAENIATEKTQAKPANGEFCWTEFATDDLEKCQRFYAEVFGWKYKNGDAEGIEMRYLEFGTASGKPVGGMFEMKPEWYGGEMPVPHINIYVAVDDADVFADRAVELGGKLVSPPMDLPNVGRMCQIEDPTGARFFIINLEK
jgi:predicted enzyme related to lactoylglutathione lyase